MQRKIKRKIAVIMAVLMVMGILPFQDVSANATYKILKTYTVTVTNVYGCTVYYRVSKDYSDDWYAKNTYPSVSDGYGGSMVISTTASSSGNSTAVCTMTDCDVNCVTPYLFVKVKDRKGYTFKELEVTKTTGSNLGITQGSGSPLQEYSDILDADNDSDLRIYIGLGNNRSELNLVWTENEYSIKYNANGGSASFSTGYSSTVKDKKYTDVFSLRSASASGKYSYTRTGYTLTGWNTKADGTGTTYSKGQSVSKLSSTDGATVNLYAVWTPNTYTIKYNGNGATSGSMSDTSATYGSSTTLRSNAFTRTGYQFNGWGTSSGATSAIYSNSASVKNLTATNGGTVNLYALWKPNTYYVSYSGNGATSGSVANSTHTYDTSSSLNANAFTKSYVYTYDANGGKVQDSGLNLDKLTKTYSATYQGWYKEVAGTSLLTAALNLTATSGATYPVYAKWSTITTILPTGKREGYDLLGWSSGSKATSPDSGYAVGESVTVSSAKTLYAIWKPRAYTIKYDANGGEGKMPDAVKTFDVDYIMPESEFERFSYEFLGWSMDKDAEEPEYQAGEVYQDEVAANYGEGKSITLYAIWRANLQVVYMQDKTEESTVGDIQYTVDALDGADYIDSGEEEAGIIRSEPYIMDENKEENDEEHFVKTEIAEYTNAKGEVVTNKITSTLVGWSFDKDASSVDYRNGYETGEYVEKAEDIKNLGELSKLKNAITYGSPNSDFSSAEATSIVAQLSDSSVKGTGNTLFNISATTLTTSNGQQLLPATDDTPYANLYAVYDRGAFIEAYDLYYSVLDAQYGYITEEELLSQVTAWDEELKSAGNPTGEVAKGLDDVNHTTFDVWDYTPTDFSMFTASGSVTKTYRVIDSAGNVTKKRITVHIVDTTAYDTKPKVGNARFISKEYFPATLASDSIWLTNQEYNDELAAVLNNERIDQELGEAIFGLPESMRVIKPGSGHWTTEPVQVWEFSHEDVLRVKDYVDEHGIGNLLEKDALANFLIEFVDNRVN